MLSGGSRGPCSVFRSFGKLQVRLPTNAEEGASAEQVQLRVVSPAERREAKVKSTLGETRSRSFESSVAGYEGAPRA